MAKLSINKLAEITGFTNRTVKRRLADLVPIIEGRSHLYDSRAALPLLYQVEREETTSFDLTAERARLAHHQANIERMKEDQLAGSLVPEQVIREYGAGMVAAFRAKILSLHNKIRNRFPGIDKEIIHEIQALHSEALDELGNNGIPKEIQRTIWRNLRNSEAAANPDSQ